MKLKNKLIPLAGVFTTCAIVAPTSLTSCAEEVIEPIDLLLYTASSKKASMEGNKATQTQAINYFAKEVVKDNNIFYNDMYNGLKTSIKQLTDQYNYTTTLLKGKVIDLSVKTIKVTGLTISELPIADYKISLDHKFTYTLSDSVGTKVTAVDHIDVECRNVPLYLEYYSTGAQIGWHICPIGNADFLNFLTNSNITWEVTYKSNFFKSYTTKIDNQQSTYTTTETDTRKMTKISQLETFQQSLPAKFLYMGGMDTLSLYMSSVALDQE